MMKHVAPSAFLRLPVLACMLVSGLVACTGGGGSESDDTTTDDGSSTGADATSPSTSADTTAGETAGSSTGSTGSTGSDGSSGETTSVDPDSSGSGDSTGEPACTLETIELPGDAFYPEGIAASADGTLYVGSVATGQIVRVTPCETEVETFVDAGTTTRNVVGMIVDDAAGLLWVCDSDFDFMSPPTVQVYDLDTATLEASHDFDAVGFCNDIALGPDGSAYVTDSSGARILRVDAADALMDTPAETWLTDPEFVVGMGEFGLNGITLADDTTVYAVNSQQGELYRIPVEAGGTPGSVTLVELDPGIVGGDGLEVLDAEHLLVVENFGGALSTVDLTSAPAVVAAVATDLDAPTTAVVVEQDAWVVQGQLDHLLGFDPAPPTVPFTIVRVSLR